MYVKSASCNLIYISEFLLISFIHYSLDKSNIQYLIYISDFCLFYYPLKHGYRIPISKLFRGPPSRLAHTKHPGQNKIHQG